MKVFYFVRCLEAVPSCMYNIQMIADLQYDVIVATGRSTKELNGIMKKKGIQYIDGQAPKGPNRGFQKVKNRILLTAALKRCVREAMKLYEDGDLVFWGTADTALAVKNYCTTSTNILSLKELHEKPWYYPPQLKKLSHKCAAVICCEKNRARVLQFRWKLLKRPYIISNKPYGYPTERCMIPTCTQTKEIVEKIATDKVIVYQARHIHFAQELINLAYALKQSGDDYQLILIGEVDNPEDKVKITNIYPNIIWTGHITAPLHLEITSYAKIGVAVYAESSLNNLFCAPNKTYEYAGFGIPILCNDVPGLVETVGINRAGICVDWSSIESIQKGIEELFKSYDLYSIQARQFYDSEDNRERLGAIISEITTRRE